MKKLILLLVLLALCAIAIVTAPAVITGAALLFKGTNLLTTAVGLPHLVGVALGLSLLPTTLVLAIKAFSPRFRRLAAIGFLTLATAYCLCAAVMKHKDDLAPVFKSVMAPVEKWEAARHDQRLAELTSQNESAKQALQTQQQKLQMADAALIAEKAARLHDQQVFLNRLSTQLADGQKGLTAAMAKMENPSLQSVVAANQRLAEASNALASAMTNGSLNLPGLQTLVEGAISNSDKAQLEVQAAAAAEAAKQSALAAAAQSALEEKARQGAGQSQQLADEQQAQAKIQAAGDAQEKAKAAALATAEKMADLEAKEKQQEEEQRKTDEAARALASERSSLENMKQQVADGQKEIEAERQKLEIEAAAKQASSSQVEQARNDQSVASEDNQDARNQEVVVAAPTKYWIIDGRGQEFGPVNLAQLQLWISQGRANGNTPTYSEGWRGWQPLGSILPCPAPVIYYRYYRQPTYYVRIWR